DRVDTSPGHLNREHQTSARGPAVDMHGACTANAVFAADMGSCRAKLVSQKIAEQHPRLRFPLDLAAVEHETDPVSDACLQLRHAIASAATARPTRRTNVRRYCALA